MVISLVFSYSVCVCVSDDVGFDRLFSSHAAGMESARVPSFSMLFFFPSPCAESQSLLPLQSKANESNYCLLITCLNPCPLLTPDLCSPPSALLQSFLHISISLFHSLHSKIDSMKLLITMLNKHTQLCK